jgi:hypothetical protein
MIIKQQTHPNIFVGIHTPVSVSQFIDWFIKVCGDAQSSPKPRRRIMEEKSCARNFSKEINLLQECAHVCTGCLLARVYSRSSKLNADSV